MKIAITGSTGQIGVPLVQALSETEHELSVWSKSGRSDTLSADLTTKTGVETLLSGGPFDVIIHLAAQSKPHLAKDEPVLNSTAISFILRKITTDTHVIFASSSHVYGTVQNIPVTTQHPVCPNTPYGIQKLTAEMHCHAHTNTSVLRFFNCIGFPPKEGTFLYDWSTQIQNGQNPIVVKNAHEELDLITTKDAAKAIVEVVIAEERPSIINVCSGKATSLKETLDDAGVEYQSGRNTKKRIIGEAAWLRARNWEPNQRIQQMMIDYLCTQIQSSRSI